MMPLSGLRVLVTGADGFIGSHLTERLLEEGARVRALCWYNPEGSLGWLDGLDADRRAALDVRLGDIRDAEFVAAAQEDINVVFHLAALIAIPHSYVAPRSYVDTNVTGTLNVLEGARRHDVGRVINTSTSEVYGTPDAVPITELHPLKGQSPYSATKIAADKLCESYARSFGTPVVTLRPFNTFGPRQSTRAVIPTILTQMLCGGGDLHLGSLHPRRDFTFVTDTVEGFIRMATADIPAGDVIQLGTGAAVSVGELVEVCRRVTGSAAEVLVDDQRTRPTGSEVEVLLSDPRKAAAALGWSPQVSLEDGLVKVADWLAPRVSPRRAAEYHR